MIRVLKRTKRDLDSSTIDKLPRESSDIRSQQKLKRAEEFADNRGKDYDEEDLENDTHE